MTQHATSCLVCTDLIDQNLLPCHCPVCPQCSAQWLSAEIQNQFLNSDSFVRCPNLQCHEKFTVKSLMAILPPVETSHASQLLLKHYIQVAPDVISCQKGNCQYYGVMPEKDCPNDLICEACGHKWKERSQFNKIETLISKVSNMQEVWNDAQTALFHLLFTVECPQCSIPIKKMGGCDHMTCRNCAHEFCWTCKQDHFKHSGEHCGVNMYIKSSIIFVFLFHVFILTGTDELMWSIVSGGIKLFMKMCFYNLTFLVLMLLVFSFICLWKERACVFNNKMKLFWYILWCAGMVYITIYHIAYLIYNHAEEMVWALGSEAALIGVIFGSQFIIQTWLKYVL